MVFSTGQRHVTMSSSCSHVWHSGSFSPFLFFPNVRKLWTQGALHDQNSGVSEDGWFTAKCWQELGSHAPGQTLWFLRVLTFQDMATHLFVLTAQTLRFLLQNWWYICASSLQGMSWGRRERILSCRNQNLGAYKEHQPHCKATNSSSEGCECFCTLQTSHFH